MHGTMDSIPRTRLKREGKGEVEGRRKKRREGRGTQDGGRHYRAGRSHYRVYLKLFS